MALSSPLHVSRLLPTLSSSSTCISVPSLSLIRQRLLPLSVPSRRRKSSVRNRTISVCSALTESSDSAKSVDQEQRQSKKQEIRALLLELADSFDLPSDFLSKLPRDLRLDLNDAAFDLSNGPVIDECGEELGELFMNLSRAWEQADTATSHSIICKFPSLEGSLTDNVKAGKNEPSASAYYLLGGDSQQWANMAKESCQGMLTTLIMETWEREKNDDLKTVVAKIAKTMTEIGKLLSAIQVTETDKKIKPESRMLKFGDLQVELTPGKAYTGAAIAFVFGIITWSLAQGIQNIPESSTEYANDNALLLVKSLRGALLTLGYSSTVLSAMSSVGLLVLAQRLGSESKSKDP